MSEWLEILWLVALLGAGMLTVIGFAACLVLPVRRGAAGRVESAERLVRELLLPWLLVFASVSAARLVAALS